MLRLEQRRRQSLTPSAKWGWFKLRLVRAINGLTQEDLANKVFVSRQTINAMEANKYVPSTVLALKIAQVFNKPVEAIFLLDEND